MYFLEVFKRKPLRDMSDGTVGVLLLRGEPLQGNEDVLLTELSYSDVGAITLPT